MTENVDEGPVGGDRPAFGDLERTVLEFERLQWSHRGTKVDQARQRFGLSETRYQQLVNHVIDLPEAVAYDAVTVHRLRRLRDARRGAREQRYADRQPPPDQLR